MRVADLRPDICLPSFAELKVDELCARTGLSKIVLATDLDGVQLGQYERKVPDEHLQVWEELGRDERIEAGASISNAEPDRVPRAEYVIDQILEAFGKEMVLTTSAETGHPKPHPEPWLATARKLCRDVSMFCHVGDQWGKDTVGAKLAGCAAAMQVVPYKIKGEHVLTHFVQRNLETAIRPFIAMPLFYAGFGDQTPDSKRYQRAEGLSVASAIGLGGLGIAGGLGEGRQRIAGAAGLVTAAGLVAHAINLHRGHEERADQELEARFRRLDAMDYPDMEYWWG